MTRTQISIHDPASVQLDTVAEADGHHWTAVDLGDETRVSIHARPEVVVALLRSLADQVEARAGLVTVSS